MPPAPDLVRQVVTRMFSTVTTDPDLKVFFAAHTDSFYRHPTQNEHDLAEHDLAWSSIYTSFEELMESKLKDIGASLGFSDAASFYDELRSKVDEDVSRDAKEQRMMDLLVSSYDYEKFVVLMRIKAASARQEEKAEDEKDEEEEKGQDGDDVDMFGDDDEE